MEGTVPTWVTVTAVVLIGAVIFYLLYLMDKRKHERLKAFAAAAGWTYQVTIRGFRPPWRGFPFNVGYSRHTSNFLTGEYRGRAVRVFEHNYTVGYGKSRSHVTQTVTMVSLPGWLPDLQITAEDLSARVSKALGGQDIQFESEEFNRRWRVESAALKTAHDIVHPRFMELMVAGSDDPMRIEGTDLWTWHRGDINIDAIYPRLERLVQIVGLVPRHVWQDYGHDPVTSGGRTP